MKRQTTIELLGDDFCRVVGSIAALRGELRFKLISAGDQLLSTRLGDQGLARVLVTSEQDLQQLCDRLGKLAEVRGVPADAMDALDTFVSDYATDCDLASRIATGSWTYLGGVEKTHFGLYASETISNGDLQPQWHDLTQEDLDSLVGRLEQAVDSLEKFVWGCRIAGAETRGMNDKSEQDG